ncbi:MAG: methylated-DNA--[protein]-cysteine S-methyltransferase [Oleispira antarctica]|nr:methylated-DNA--[protein]-cysteine S-methyltransferase [Oleispira antarctica]MBQ0791598.1 methylated-DNA--[protein]-cysteine S-methyltransferase [Oleispira antarctica]
MSSTCIQYHKIAKAIAYLDDNFKQQPSLDQVAEQLNMSAFHFQRLFKEWVGISPKKYLQFLTVSYVKSQLEAEKSSLLKVAAEAGLSGSGRLHDLFVNIEGMTPGEYKKGGQNLAINYSFSETPFGDVVVASTEKGICYLAFIDSYVLGLEELKKIFPNASYQKRLDNNQKNTLCIFQHDWSQLNKIKLHLKGTDFQLKVWQALLTIPQGGLVTYGNIARRITQPTASRAVGTAIGSNPIAFLIPCHRVIQSSGNIGGYRWNPIRKKAIIGWEAAKQYADE